MRKFKNLCQVVNSFPYSFRAVDVIIRQATIDGVRVPQSLNSQQHLKDTIAQNTYGFEFISNYQPEKEKFTVEDGEGRIEIFDAENGIFGQFCIFACAWTF